MTLACLALVATMTTRVVPWVDADDIAIRCLRTRSLCQFITFAGVFPVDVTRVRRGRTRHGFYCPKPPPELLKGDTWWPTKQEHPVA